MSFNVDKARSHFEALRQDQVFMDNAGGSQTLDSVADSIQKYLKSTNVQLGASYPIGSQSTQRVSQGYEAAARYINADVKDIGMS
jgi:selenocysteine lyase/cysteine desulfurase